MNQPEQGAGKRQPQLPVGITIRQAIPNDAAAIHALLRPYVMQRLLLARSEAELIELTRHGFVALRALSGSDAHSDSDARWDSDSRESEDAQLVGFSAIEIYSRKLAELQCLAVHHDFRGTGVGRALVAQCVDRARDLNVMEVMAISSSADFLQSCGFDYALPDQKKALFCQLKPRPIE